MKQWKGLMKKEWASMKAWFYAMIIGTVILAMGIPFLLTLIMGGANVVVESLMLGALWGMLSTFAPLLVLASSLNNEMKHPDIWLHSNASTYKLFNVKAVFALLICSFNLLIPAFIIITQYSFSNLMVEVTLGEVATFGVIFTLSLFMVAILIMSKGLFFWVIYHLIKPYLRGFSIPVVIGLFLASAKFLDWIEGTDIYRKVAEIGPFGEALSRDFEFNKGSSYLYLEDSALYTGEVILNVLFIIVLFVSASYLFEKKVRI